MTDERAPDRERRRRPPEATTLESPLSATWRPSVREKAVLVGIGPGIAEADLPHVFERFYRADPARGRDPGGTGLGLAIAAWIVEQHGGEIALTSQPAQGTRVTVLLPAA